MRTAFQKVSPKTGTEIFGRVYYDNDITGPSEIAASVVPYGKGRIACINFDLGSCFLTGATAASREFLAALVHRLFPNPVVKIKGSHYVDVVLKTINGKLAVNLINTAGPHAQQNIYTYDEIPPVGPLEIMVVTGNKPGKVVSFPEKREIEFDYDKGTIKFIIPRLDIHQAILIE